MGKHKGLRIFLFYCTVFLLFLAGITIGDRAVTVMSENLPIHAGNTIVIDAGHGGEDGGAVSCTGKNESMINLEISLQIRDLFHLLGFQTKMIRDGDYSIAVKGDTVASRKASDLHERVNAVNGTENAILISIHQNQYPEAKYSGAQVFYSDSYRSKQFAQTMQETLSAALNPSNRRQIKKGEGIYLLEHVKGCGILVECGFLSNPREEKCLTTHVYQNRIASAVVSATALYLEMLDRI